MKFIKRLALDRKNQTSDRFAVESDNRIVTTSKVSLQLPSGATSDRPSGTSQGRIRFNQTTGETEIYNNNYFASSPNGPWEQVKTNRQTTITPQNLGVGNYLNTVFGPLSYPVDTTKPQNVLVFIDSVYQMPTTNYTLQLGSNVGVTKHVVGITGIGTSTIVLDSVADIFIGESIDAPTGINIGTTVTSVITATNSIEISIPTSGILANNSTCTFTAINGTDVYVKFTGTAPNGQVFSLMGFDGYSP